MDIRDRYLFDLNGYLVLRSLLQVEQVSELNDKINVIDPWRRLADLELDLAETSWWHVTSDSFLKWVFGRCRDHLQIGPVLEWGECFKNVPHEPALAATVTELVGRDFYVDHANLILARRGGVGFDMHGGLVPYRKHQYYAVRDGQFDVGMLVVVIPLTPQTATSGGLTIVRGSHKANFPPPERITDVELADLWWSDKLTLHPGDAIVFSEASAHGVIPWSAEWERRAILLKIFPSHIRSIGSPLRPPSEPFWAPACKEDMVRHPLIVGRTTREYYRAY
jgi:hypothetical protein